MEELRLDDSMVPETESLSNAELDLKLDNAVQLNEKSLVHICFYLAEVQKRGAFREFGYATLAEYAMERFSYEERKTRYLVHLGKTLGNFPKIRAALEEGKIGWFKATILTKVAKPEDETTWVDSAIGLTVKELEKLVKGGGDDLSGPMNLWLSHDDRVLLENVFEVCRRKEGAELRPTEILRYMCMECLSSWLPEVEEQEKPQAPQASATTTQEAPETSMAEKPLVSDEVEKTILSAQTQSYEEIRKFVLERDGWKCTYPGCHQRRNLHVHHLEFRSHGGPNDPWNLTTVCAYHHAQAHERKIQVRGRAPFDLNWTPPKLMQAVIERRRNRPAQRFSELEVREWRLKNGKST